MDLGAYIEIGAAVERGAAWLLEECEKGIFYRSHGGEAVGLHVTSVGCCRAKHRIRASLRNPIHTEAPAFRSYLLMLR